VTVTHGTLTHFDSAFGRYWSIEATPNIMVRLKRIFPRAHPGSTYGQLRLHDTDEVCRDLRWVLDRWPLKVDRSAKRKLNAGARRHQKREEVSANILAGGQYQLPADALEPIREPRRYQLEAADLALANHSLLIADDLGLGKTFTGLLLLRDPATLPALVVCPTHLPEQWKGELAKSFPTLNAHVVKKGRPYDPTQGRRPEPTPDVWIINYAKLAGWAYHLADVLNSVIFDECQELRVPGSDKHAAACHIADHVRYRVGLTATPVYNYGGEIHSIFSAIAPDELGSLSEFTNEWGRTFASGQLGVREPRELGHHLRTENLLLRRTRADVGRELPDVQRISHTVESDEDKLEEVRGDVEALAELILNSPDRKERFVKSGELDWKLRQATGKAKAPYVAAFVRMLLESGEKVCLFGWHREVYDRWLTDLAEFSPAMYTGTESPVQKRKAKARFLTSPDEWIDDDLIDWRGPMPVKEGKGTNLLVMSLRSGAGLDGLQEHCHIAVFGELDWSPGMHDQCIGRLHRDGMDEPVVAYFLVSDEGSDPVIAETLNIKRGQGEPIRDPDRELLEAAGETGDRVKELARSILGERRVAA